MRGEKGLRFDIVASHAVFHPEAKGNRKEMSPSFLFLEFCECIEMRGVAKAARKGRSVGKIGARSRNKSDFANNQLNYGAIVRVCVGTAAQVALRCLACALGAGANTLFN